MTKIPAFEYWNLEFVIYLLFGACYLKFNYRASLLKLMHSRGKDTYRYTSI
jgi:hypothetical protein